MKQIRNIINNKKIYIIATIVLSIILGILYTFVIKGKLYKSTSTIIVGRNAEISNETESGEKVVSEVKVDSNLVTTYCEIMKNDIVLEDVRKNVSSDMNIKKFKNNISIKRIPDTELIEIIVVNKDSKKASDIANETVKIFSEKIKEVYKINNIYVLSKAIPSEVSFNFHPVRSIGIFTLIGIVASGVYVYVLYKLNMTIKTSDDIGEECELNELISIPSLKKNEENLVTLSEKKSIVSERFRDLKTNIQFTNVNAKRNKILLISSSSSDEGKEFVSANLAITFAKAGKKVILIDSDMQNGKLAEMFGVPNELGFSNYLSNLDSEGIEINERINSFIKETGIKNLNIITAGNTPPNILELLESEKLDLFIKDLSVFYDLIMFNGSPILTGPESLVLTRIANSTVIVAMTNKTRIDDINNAKNKIRNANGRIIGVVLNHAKIKKVTENKENKVNIKKERKIKEEKERKEVSHDFKWYMSIIKRNINKIVRRYGRKEKQLLLNESKESNKVEEKKNKDNEIIKEVKGKNTKKEKQNISKKDKNIRKEKEEVKESVETDIQNMQNIENTKVIENVEDIKNTEVLQKEENKEIVTHDVLNNDEQIVQEPEKEELTNNQKIAIEISKYLEKTSQEAKKISNRIKSSFEKAGKKLKEKRRKRQSQAVQNNSNIENEVRNIRKENLEELKEDVRILDEERIKEERLLEEERRNEEKILEEERLEEERILEVEKILEENRRIEEAKKIAREQEKILEKARREELKKEKKNKKILAREEKRKNKEQKRKKQQEEARIKEELLEDNLYPKTKYNKNL